MKKEVTKKVTIDDLAVMITEGREETNELARMVARGFSSKDKKFSDKFNRIDKRFDAADERFESIEKSIEGLEESIATTNNNVLSLGDRTVPRFEFESLMTRIVRLERKTKV